MDNQVAVVGKGGKSKKRLIIAVIVIAVACVAGILGWRAMASLSAGTGGAEMPSVVALAPTSLESKVTASGNFASVDPVTVGSNVQGGEVETVFVEAGDVVYEGDVLAKLKTSDIERSISDAQDSIADAAKSDKQKLESAQRAFDDANTQYYADLDQNNKAVAAAEAALNATKAADQTNPDYQKNLGAAQDAYDKAVAQRDSTTRSDNSRWYDAKAQLDSLTGQDSAKRERTSLESLNEDLANASIVAPISGVVTKVNTEDGKAASGDMFTVEDTGALQISASVAEYDIIKIEEGMAAHVTSNATDDVVYDGVVDFVSPVASDTSGNFVVKVRLTGEPGQLRPGMTATVEIVVASKEGIFAVPIDAVVDKGDGTKVVYALDGAFGGRTQFAPTEGVEAGAGGLDSGSGSRMTGEGGAGGLDSGPASGMTGAGDGAAPAAASTGTRREIVVTTGMETDYYIEIISDELSEGLLILSDPMGLNVSTGGGMNQFGMMGGQPVMGAEIRVADGGGQRGGGPGGNAAFGG